MAGVQHEPQKLRPLRRLFDSIRRFGRLKLSPGKKHPWKRKKKSEKVAQLPQEIIDAVLDHLYCDDVTLRACALVACAWRPRAQYHLFRLLVLRDQAQLSELFEVFGTPLHIASAVKHLILHPAELSSDEQHWIPDTIAHFHRQSRLNGVSIFNAGVSRSLKATLSYGFTSQMTALTLEDCVVDSQDNLIAIVRANPLLRQLATVGITVRDSTPPRADTPLVLAHLQHLGMDCNNRRFYGKCVTDALLRHTRRALGGLVSFRLANMEDEYDTTLAARYLHALSSSLSHFRLGFRDGGAKYYSMLGSVLSRHGLLRSFALDFSPFSQPVPAIDILGLVHAPDLTTLHINFECFDPEHPYLLLEPWLSLVEVVRQRFPKLQELNIPFSIMKEDFGYGYGRGENAFDILRSHLCINTKDGETGTSALLPKVEIRILPKRHWSWGTY